MTPPMAAGQNQPRAPIGAEVTRPVMTPPVVHLELHTGDMAAAAAFYHHLLGWRTKLMETSAGLYLALDLGGGPGGGIVECPVRGARWVPYVEVDAVDEVTQRAGRLGARILLPPREGPSGWRSVVCTPGAGELALWQPRQ